MIRLWCYARAGQDRQHIPRRGEILLAVRGSGELIGELNALATEGPPRAATVIALSDVTAQTIAAAEFLTFLERRPKVALALLRQLADRLRESSNRHVDAGAYHTLHRVARSLVGLAERGGRVVDDGVLVADGLTQEDLAGLVASSRETVARALAALRSQGLIATGRRSIVVRDLTASACLHLDRFAVRGFAHRRRTTFNEAGVQRR